MQTIEKIEKIALYVAFSAIGFSTIALISGGSLVVALVFAAVLGIGIGTADVLICFVDYFTEFGLKLISTPLIMVAFLAVFSSIFALGSSLLEANHSLLSITTWLSAFASVLMVTSPFTVNSIMRDQLRREKTTATGRNLNP